MPRVVRALALLIGIAALVALGVWLAAPSRDALEIAARRLAHVSTMWLVTAGAFAIAPAFAEAVRVKIAARIVGAGVRASTALDAAMANALFTSVTPVTGLGEPSVAWVLAKRGGVAVDTAILVPFVKFTTSFVFVFAVGAVIYAIGAGPPGTWLGVIGALVSLVAASVVAVVFVGPRAHAIASKLFGWLGRRRLLSGTRTKRWLARGDAGLHESLDRLAKIPRRGFGLLIASHALYYAVYVAPIAILCEALVPGTGLTAMPRALAYLCMLFLAPTPGGAGLGEATAGVFFGDLIGTADAVIVVLAYRVGRIAGQVVLPALYLSVRANLSADSARKPPSM